MTTLYQVNIRVLLQALGREIGRAATFDDIPEAWIESWKSFGFDWIWLLSVWQTGPTSRDISRKQALWRQEFLQALPDLDDDDIQGSGFAITSYSAHEKLGGDDALRRLRERMHRHGLKLMLDFVPNHFGLDHPWIDSNPELFMEGNEELLDRLPQNYFRHASGRIFARGRDPYFPGWEDTIQLNYTSPALHERMLGEVSRIATLCDGVRADMAMLILPDVFEKTWGAPALPFWPEAIALAREQHPTFCFLAEVYWGREWDLQQLGFDYCYDKRLYDRLLHEDASAVEMHLIADLTFQSKLARFLENHDEPRVNSLLEHDQHYAAAVICYFTPGLKFFHEGQLDGRKIKVSPHVVRRMDEPVDEAIHTFYEKLIPALNTRYLSDGKWLLMEAKPAWDGNTTNESLIAFRWKDPESRHLLVAVNYSPKPAQGRIRISIDRNCVSEVCWKNLFTGQTTTYHRGAIFNPGLLLQLEPWQFVVLEEVDSAE